MVDVDKLDLFLDESVGVKTRVFHFPGGALAPGGLKKECIAALHDSGYKYVEWNAYKPKIMSFFHSLMRV